jgi:hypothetical protein
MVINENDNFFDNLNDTKPNVEVNLINENDKNFDKVNDKKPNVEKMFPYRRGTKKGTKRGTFQMLKNCYQI